MRQAIVHRESEPVIRHRAEAVRDHVEEVADRHRPEAIDVVRRRLLEAALHDHAVAFAGLPWHGAQ
jgi:hypothetical protein